MPALDYAAIIFYAVFMAGVGFLFIRRNKNSSDFFRAGGALTWWLVGASSFVTIFSAWTFVGCAGRVFRTGTSTSLVFLFNVVGLSLTFFVAPKVRRLRVVSWVEAVRLRFGRTSEQFFIYLSGIVGLLFGGVALYTIAVFLSPVFNLPTTPIILCVAALVAIISTTGGSIAIISTDFIQSLFIVAIGIVVAVLVIQLPEIGSLSILVEKSPSKIFDWTEAMSPGVLGLWGLALLINQIVSTNSLSMGAARYLAVRDETHARLAVLFPWVGMFVLPIIAFIPPIAATFLTPNIDELFPLLNNPSEASYVAMAMNVLPAGMTGMLACAIFAATLTSLNAALSINAAVITRNIYLGVLRPQAPEKELLFVGRAATLLLVIIMTGIGLGFQALKDLPLFELTLALAGLVGMPMTLPLVLGIFIRRTPNFSGWGTVIVGSSLSCIFWFAVPLTFYARLLHLDPVIDASQVMDTRFAITLIAATLGSTVFFLLTRFVDPKEESTQRKDFFDRMEKPIDTATEISGETVSSQAILIGKLGMIYGGGVMSFCLFAASWKDRPPFLMTGGIVFAICLLLYSSGKKGKRSQP